MKLAYALLAAALCVTPVFGQDGSSLSSVMPVPVQDFAALKQYLTLSDAQVASLRQIQENRNKAQQAVWEQIRTKQMELDRLLQQGSNDAVAIGRLMVDINNVRRQVPDVGPYKTQALAVLNEAQKQKLGTLQQALQIQQTAWEAVTLNLIEPPQPDVRILPFPAAEPAVSVVTAP